ncbi:MAG TPA: hypothetical protein PK871_09065 [Mycobacterium sp.]|jgi:predicted nucleic acid-binding protein|nr:hypothetical protein [Mycobacterium sp.]
MRLLLKLRPDLGLQEGPPRWDLLPVGDHEFLVSAIAFAEFSEGAAVAIGDGAVLATRNTADFEGLEPLLNVITL